MTLDTHFEKIFREIVLARITALSEQLANPTAVPHHANYMFRVGQITALRDMVPDLLAETTEIINKR